MQRTKLFNEYKRAVDAVLDYESNNKEVNERAVRVLVMLIAPKFLSHGESSELFDYYKAKASTND